MKDLVEGFSSSMTVPNAGKRLLETEVMFLTSLLDLLLNSNDDGDLSSDVPNAAAQDLPLLNSNGNGDLASEVVVDMFLFFPSSSSLYFTLDLFLPLSVSLFHLYYCFTF